MEKKPIFFTQILLYIFCFISMYAIEELPITIVIPSYNNATIFKKNIDSVLSQTYHNYRIIYTDDCSPDETGSLISEYIQHHPKKNIITIIKNNNRLGALHNLYNMIHSCHPDDIIIALDGDDWLPHPNVLQRINETYQSQNVWLTYGQFQLFPGGQKGWASPMPDTIITHNAFREYEHLPTHLRTFKAWLFQEIALKDLLFLGDFYTMTWDMVMMFPMIEMAGERHHCFVDEILYIYNDNNTISDHKISRQLQAYLAQIVRAKKRYTRLEKKPEPSDSYTKKTASILFSFNNPTLLPDVLTSIDEKVIGLSDIHVIYYAATSTTGTDYDTIKSSFPTIHFHKLAPNAADFRLQFIHVLETLDSDYILFLKDTSIFTRTVQLTDCIRMLEKTKAYAFYYTLSRDCIDTKTSPMLHPICLNETVCAWHFYMARDIWSCANSVDGVLHRNTKTIHGFVQAQYMPNPEGFELVWANQGDLDRVGLCFTTAHTKKVVS